MSTPKTKKRKSVFHSIFLSVFVIGRCRAIMLYGKLQFKSNEVLTEIIKETADIKIEFITPCKVLDITLE